MANRSLNKVQLIGNMTRDPELRYTPTGTAVCTFGVATNRQWMLESGEKREETEFHRVVAWNKLGELCSQLLTKGRKVYVEGRLQTRTWTGQDGNQRTTTEIVIDDMIILDSRKILEGMPTGTGIAVPPVGATDVQAMSHTNAVPVSVGSTTITDASAADEKPKYEKKSPTTSAGDKMKEEEVVEQPTGAPTGSEDLNPEDIPF